MINQQLKTAIKASTMLSAALLAAATAQAQTAAAPAATTAAATTDAGGIADIIITADRRAESIQTVPIAVSAFSTSELASRGITSTIQLVQYVPNLFGSNNTGLGSANAYYLRGLGNTETIPTFDPPVGTYIDDIYIARQNANNFSFFDLERIEVLRGPQGTLFGRNTTAGAINVILKKPGETLGGYAEIGYGAYHKWLGRASIDVPLGDLAAIKVSGYYQKDRGYVHDSITGETLNDNDASGIRGALRIGGSTGFSWNVAAAYMRNTGENLINFDCDPNNPSNCSGRFATTGMLQNRPSNSYYAYGPAVVTGEKANYPMGNVVKSTLITSDLQYAGENIALNLITGIVRTSQDYALDFADGRGLPSALVVAPPIRGFASGGFAIANQGQFNEFTQEAKLSGKLFNGLLEYVVGAYFFKEDSDSDFADIFNLAFPGPAGFPFLLADRRLINSTNAKAGYAQFDLHPFDRLTITGGIRYTDEKKTFSIRDNRAACQTTGPIPTTCLEDQFLFSNGVAIPTEQRTKQWTPKFVVTWQQDADLMVYASASNGFKSGGWNARGTTNASLLPFAPEKAWSYEAGLKSQWFDDRLRANLTAFLLDVKDLQTPSAAVSPTGAVSFITQNFADYRNKGLELELTAKPLDHLSLYTSVGYQDDNYKVDMNVADFTPYGVKSVPRQQRDCRAQLAQGKIPLGSGASNAPDCGAGIIDANGNIATPVRTPKFSIAAGGTWDFPLPSAGITISPTVNVVYRSDFETGTSNATIYTGAVTSSFNGQVYPNNPFGGDVVTGSHTRATTLVNASLALTTDDRNWMVSVDCTNCFDITYGESSLVNYTYLNTPRTWTVRAKRSF